MRLGMVGPSQAGRGYMHFGSNGADHPGFYRGDLDIAEVRRRSGVIGSWLLDPTAAALRRNCALAKYADKLLGGNAIRIRRPR
ncbi:MAG TPA: hypothetical protein VEK34_03185 [Methylocella sp.]|nr:hypothetical protein [Methylocella sp.]